MFINIFPCNNNYGVSQKQNFEGRLPKKVFSDIRDIPRLTCAKCGNELIMANLKSLMILIFSDYL